MARKGSIWQSIVAPGEVVRIDSGGKEQARVIDGIKTGCEACDLNVMPGLHKFTHAQTEGKPMLWFRAPTRHESDLRQPMRSNAAQALGKFLREWGLKPNDFEVRYAVKCAPCVNTVKGVLFREAPQDRHYIHCLSHSHNLVQLNQKKRAGVETTSIVFGGQAAQQIYEREFKSDTPIFWSGQYNCKVFVLEHPTPALVEGATADAERWRARLDAALFSVCNPGRYALLDVLDIRQIHTLAEFKRLIADIAASGETVTIDIEDDGQGTLLCVGFCYDPAFATVLVWDHPKNPQPPTDKLREALVAFLADPRYKKVFQFGSYDAVEFEERGWRVGGYVYDTFYGSYLSASYLRKHGLEAIAQRNFPTFADYKSVVAEYYEKDETGENAAADRGAAGLARCPLLTLIKYNGADTILTKLEEMRTRGAIHPELMAVYIGAGKTLRKMESNGPLLDATHQEIVKRVANKRLREVEERLRAITANPNFNPGSPQQVLYYLHEVFHLPKLSDFDEDFATQDGEEDEGTTEENALVRIYQETGHEFPKLILERRKYESYETKYAGAYKSSADHWDGEVRTKYHLAGAASGRLRSGGGKRKKDAKVKFVNLQNITRTPFIKNLLCSDPNWREVLRWLKPVLHWMRGAAPPVSTDKGAEWPAWKKANFAELVRRAGKIPDYVLNLTVFCTFDLSQAELRVLALFSRDPELIKMFIDGRDVHCLVGVALGLGSYEDIKANKELRTNIKALNFGLVYGLEAKGLYWYMKGLGATASMEEVADMRAKFFARFRGVARLIEYRHQQWRRDGFIDTPYHFRRWMGPEYEPGRKTNWDNISMNSPIQGTAHMLMLIALHVLAIQPKTYERLSGVSMEVHDALIFKTPVRYLEETYNKAQDLLENQTVRYTKDRFKYNIDVPIVAEGGIGFRYGVELETPDFSGGLAGVLLSWALKNLETEAALAHEFGYDAPAWY